MSRLAVICALLVLGGAAILVVPSPPRELPARTLASIRVPEGFRVELAAKPGLLRYPMLGTIDDRGRLFMCESSGRTMKTPEMTANPDYQVTLAVDTDRDGVFDKATVFADRLTLPAGAVWLDGSLYVAAPPSLYRFTDTNEDGVADLKEIVVTGWNLSANAASLHGPILGPDGWLYLTDGRHGFNITTKEGKLLSGKASRIWRVRPDGSGLETFAGGGFDNPVEVVFTDPGEVIGTMTYFTDPRDGQRDALLHFVEGGVYPKPHPAMDELVRTGDLMPVMTKFARVAPAGLLRYKNGNFGAQYQGNLFTAHFNSHRVLRHILTRHGATFRTADEDFLVSSDPDFHPTDVIQDFDGSMLVVDTGAWFIHGCPLSRYSKPNIRGGLYRVRPNNAAAIGTSDPPARRVFSLSGKPLREALSHPDFETRIAAARQLGMARDRDAVTQLMAMVRKDLPAVRRQAATALGQIAEPRAVSALLDAAARPDDRFVEHAIIYSLIQIADSQPLLAALAHPSAAVRKAALIALHQIPGSPLRPAHILPLITHTDADLRRAALWVASRSPAWNDSLASALEARLRDPSLDDEEGRMLSAALSAACGSSVVNANVARALGDPGLPRRRQILVLDTVENCAPKQVSPSWKPGLIRLLSHTDSELRLRTISLVRNRGITGLENDLRRIAESGSSHDNIRIAALSALGATDATLSPASLQFLASRLSPQTDAQIKLDAAQVLLRAALTDSQLLLLARNHLSSVDPIVLPTLLQTAQRTSSPEVQRTWQPHIDRHRAARSASTAKISRLAPLLRAKGDPVLGKELFFGARAGCSSCHTIGENGGHVGPDLTAIGGIRSPHDLLEAIVLPSASFVPGHEVYRVETDSDVYSGVLRSRQDDAVILITGPGDEVRIPRASVRKMGFAPVSLMPDGYDEVLSPRELSDLLAFLQAQTVRPAAAGEAGH